MWVREREEDWVSTVKLLFLSLFISILFFLVSSFFLTVPSFFFLFEGWDRVELWNSHYPTLLIIALIIMLLPAFLCLDPKARLCPFISRFIAPCRCRPEHCFVVSHHSHLVRPQWGCLAIVSEIASTHVWIPEDGGGDRVLLGVLGKFFPPSDNFTRGRCDEESIVYSPDRWWQQQWSYNVTITRKKNILKNS